MRENIDFIIEETANCKMIFRFLPQESQYYDNSSNSEEKPKLYYSYKIITMYDDGTIIDTFSSGRDECSVIDEVALACDLLSKGQKEIIKTTFDKTITIRLLNSEMYPLGDGVSWIIRRPFVDKYCFQMFKWDNTGYRFYLKKERMKEFADYLNECCEYMLKHGEPI